MPVITLPDGSQRSFEQPVTVAGVAANIGAGLAKAALAGRVDGKLVDTSHVIDHDATVSIVTGKDPDGLEIIRHSTAHLLAQAVQAVYPEAQVTIGPVIEDGFYYDFAFSRPFTPEDLAKFEAKMHELAKADLKVERRLMPRDAAVETFKKLGEHYKAEIIASIPANEDISLYGQGDWFDLCRGPHVPSTGKLGAFKLMKVAGAYWRGDSKNAMLQRIYGTAWADEKALKAYLTRLEEAEKRDHRRVGRDLGLFHTQEEAVGSVFWHPKGHTLWRTVETYMRNRLEAVRLRRGQDAAAARSRAVGEVGPLGKLPAQHVHRRIRGSHPRGQADELPGARAHLSAGHQVVPRPAAAHGRVRRLPSQRALGCAARPDARACVHAGRRAHLLHRRPDQRRDGRVLRPAHERLQGLRLRGSPASSSRTVRPSARAATPPGTRPRRPSSRRSRPRASNTR